MHGCNEITMCVYIGMKFLCNGCCNIRETIYFVSIFDAEKIILAGSSAGAEKTEAGLGDEQAIRRGAG